MTWWLVVGFALGGTVGGHLVDGLGVWSGGGGALVAWLAHSVRYPRTACWWCSGQPKYRDGSGKFWRNCWWCGGSGQRRRIGARILARHR